MAGEVVDGEGVPVAPTTGFSLGNNPLPLNNPLLFVIPKRTRISYLTALTRATYVVLVKENHMQLTEATTLERKSGEAEGSVVSRTSLGDAKHFTPTIMSSRLPRRAVGP
jgi:hypothetical protein